MYELMSRSHGPVVAIRISGKMSKEDYESLLPFIEEKAEKQEGIRLFIDMNDFEGWDSLSAAFTGWSSSFNISLKIERCAVIGDQEWQSLMGKIFNPLEIDQFKQYGTDESKEAWAWIQEGVTADAS